MPSGVVPSGSVSGSAINRATPSSFSRPTGIARDCSTNTVVIKLLDVHDLPKFVYTSKFRRLTGCHLCYLG